jgi:hypothetical protein
MSYIENIDYALSTKIQTNEGWVTAKPLEASGLLKWKIRLIKALYVLKGKADAFTYSNQ